jgi:hypothetical protein
MGAHRFKRRTGRRMVGLVAFTAMSFLAWGLPVSAQAAAPQITTDGAHATSGTHATISGNGDPNGPSTTLHADYALASELWCTSHGAEGTPHETGRQELGSGNVEISEILVELSGLNAASEYCAELVAENKDGIAHGGQVRFTTPIPPSIDSESVSHLTPTDATLEAQINTEDFETIYEFQLRSPLCKPPAECIPIVVYSLPSGKLLGSFVDQSVSLDLNSAGVTLRPGKEYLYSVTATNATGSAEGHWQTFEPPEDVAQPPTTTTPPGTQMGTVTQNPGQVTITDAASAITTDRVLSPPKSTPKPRVLTNAQKLAIALKVCKHKLKRQRAGCEKHAHKKHGTTARAARAHREAGAR